MVSASVGSVWELVVEAVSEVAPFAIEGGVDVEVVSSGPVVDGLSGRVRRRGVPDSEVLVIRVPFVRSREFLLRQVELLESQLGELDSSREAFLATLDSLRVELDQLDRLG